MQGAAGSFCKGRVAITARGKVGKRVRLVHCGSAHLVIRAGHSRTLHARVGSGCAALLAKAKHHRIRAKLKATFSTHQARLKAPVTLIRR